MRRRMLRQTQAAWQRRKERLCDLVKLRDLEGEFVPLSWSAIFLGLGGFGCLGLRHQAHTQPFLVGVYFGGFWVG